MADTTRWRRLVYNSPEATVYHTPEWSRLLQDSFGHEPHHLFSYDRSGELIGFLPLMKIRGLGGNRLSSVPLAHSCIILGNKATQGELLDEGIRLAKRLQCETLEIRGKADHPEFRSESIFDTYVLMLDRPPDIMRGGLPHSLRRKLVKSKERGVTVVRTRSRDILKKFFEVNCRAKRNLGVPCHQWRFFENLFRIFGKQCMLYVALCQHDIVGGAIMEYFRDVALYAYSATNPGFYGLDSADTLLWSAISDATDWGFKKFDFGTAAKTDSGLARFKMKWGTIKLDAPYSYLADGRRPPMLEAYGGSSALYKIGGEILRSTPVKLYKEMSDLVFGRLV